MPCCPHLHLDCNRVDMDNCLNSDHLIGIRAKTAAEEVNRLRNWKRTKERSEENRYGQMTPSERVAFALSEEGKNFLFPWGFTVDGKRYEKMVPGRVARVFDEESRLTKQYYSREETSQIFRTAFLLFAGYVDAATTFAQNCGGGGSAPDQNWGRDKNEDDILWARRCFSKAREMVTTPVIRRGMRR